MKPILIIALIAWSASFTWAQTVETVAGPSPRINNGLVVHASGEIYASDLFGTGFNGTSLYKITPDGSSTLYATGLSQPAGLVFDTAGLLYVAEFTSGEISTVDAQGTVTLFASGLSQPSDLVFDAAGTLYVTNYGNGTISSISPTGMVSLFATGFSQPVGLAIDPDQNLYCANLNTGNIHKVDTLGNVAILATLMDFPIGFMTYSQETLYVCSTGGHLIYRVSLAGDIDLWLGNGLAGTVDGDATIAQFTNPDGIAASPTGDTLYVSENNTQLLRRIILNTTTGLDGPLFSPLSGLTLSPNPIDDEATLSYELSHPCQIEVELLSVTGTGVKTLLSAHQQSGRHTLKLPVSDLPAGIYYCQLKGGGGTQTIKLRVD